MYLNVNWNTLFTIITSLLGTVLATPLVPRAYDGQAWMLENYEVVASKQPHGVLQKTFETELTVQLGTEFDAGFSSDGVYTMQGHFNGKDATNMICKIMKGVNNAALGEVLALKKVENYIASGMCKKNGVQKPCIIMDRVEGNVLNKYKGYKQALDHEKSELKQVAINKMCHQVADLGAKKRIFHFDNNISNVCVTVDPHESSKKARRTSEGSSQSSFSQPPPPTVKDARVCDWGATQTFVVDEKTTYDQIYKYCINKWTPAAWKVASDEEVFSFD